MLLIFQISELLAPVSVSLMEMKRQIDQLVASQIFNSNYSSKVSGLGMGMVSGSITDSNYVLKAKK
jgi:hypothetical protein